MATGTQGHRYRVGDTWMGGDLPPEPPAAPKNTFPNCPDHADPQKNKEKKEKGIFWTIQAGSKADLWPAF